MLVFQTVLMIIEQVQGLHHFRFHLPANTGTQAFFKSTIIISTSKFYVILKLPLI